jgi:hypothetical protein
MAVGGTAGLPPAVLARYGRKTFFQPLRPIAGEYSGGYTLLKRADPAVFLGTDTGVVLTANVLPGGDFPEDQLKQPVKMADQDRLRFRRTAPTESRRQSRIGGYVASALAFPGREIAMHEIWHPLTEESVVAGWDPERKHWVVE